LPESILVPGAGEANGRTETRHVYEDTLTGANGAQPRRIPLGNAKPSASGAGLAPELETLGGRRAPRGPADSGL